MGRWLSSFGTVWLHPSRGGSTLFNSEQKTSLLLASIVTIAIVLSTLNLQKELPRGIYRRAPQSNNNTLDLTSGQTG